jgi:hypothetical protein
MSKVLDDLAASSDGMEKALGRALKAYQDNKASRGVSRGIGYEPRDILKFGAAAVIESRVRKKSSGFDGVPAELSYEAIVLAYSDRFADDVVAIARERMGREAEVLEPTADPVELEQRVHELLNRTTVAYPKGVTQPQRATTTAVAFLRDPGVKAYVLHRAKGRCEACRNLAPFKTEGGSDRVQNAVALCPNCHRAMHHAADAKKRIQQLYSQVGSLLPE